MILEPFIKNGHDFITIVCTHCGRQIDVPIYCGNRFCEVCSIRRLRRVRRRLEFIMNSYRMPQGYMFKHLTLTCPNQVDLDAMVSHLIKSFRKLRNRSYWKNHVRGGAFVIEVTNSGQGWHAHIHAVIIALRIKWDRLRDLWRVCSKGGIGVYISNIPKTAAIAYLTKYMTKPDCAFEHQLVAAKALKGTRLFQPFGDFYHLNLLYRQPPSLCPHCKAHSSYLPYDLLYADVISEKGWSKPIKGPVKPFPM